MNSQQDILHPILDLISTEAAATGESSQIGGDRLEERKIGALVATLAARHQRRPIVGRRPIFRSEMLLRWIRRLATSIRGGVPRPHATRFTPPFFAALVRCTASLGESSGSMKTRLRVGRSPQSCAALTSASRNQFRTWSELLNVRLVSRRNSREEPTMNRIVAATAFSTAVGLAMAMQSLSAQAADPPQIVKDNMERMAKNHLEKCYGINAAAKNDCAEGAHSCAGQATKARETKSFVLLPAGDCGKIQGGSLKAS